MTPTSQWIDTHHTFTHHLSFDATANPALVGMCHPNPIFAAILANSTLPKWQCIEGNRVFPAGGSDQLHRPGMAILYYTPPTPFSAMTFFHLPPAHARTLMTIALSQSDLSLLTLLTHCLFFSLRWTTPQPTFVIVAFMLLMHLEESRKLTLPN